MKIVTVDQMRRIEQECSRFGISTADLMENAGRAVAAEIARLLDPLAGKRIVILIGPGNNGGDGLVAARHLHERGAGVMVYLPIPRPEGDSNLKLVRERAIPVIEGDAGRLVESLRSATAGVDSFFGTGSSRPLSGDYAAALELVAEAQRKRGLCLIAVDLPSGLNADTGAVDTATPFADYTITLGYPKPGLFSFPGAERVGKLSIVDIGIPPELAADVKLELITDGWARAILPPRPLNANKGTFGRVLIAGGSINYIGAAYLACMGAERVGAGLVTLATARSLLPALAAKLTETTYIPLPDSEPGIIALEAIDTIREQLSRYDVLLAGCGLGQHESTVRFLAALVQSKGLPPSVVLDADGLGILSKHAGWWEWLGDAVLTPHPGEMAKLTHLEIREVQSNRIETAARYAARWNKTIVLKGAFSVIAAPDGRCRISPTANPGLASAGTGDVLAGAIAGMLAQGCSLFDSACLGSYIHGKAGLEIRTQVGDAGMVASDLLPEFPRVIKRLKGGTCS